MCYGRMARYIGNLRRNWVLPVTAFAFFGLMLTRDQFDIQCQLILTCIFTLAAMLCNQDLPAMCRHAAPWCHILAGGTALYLVMQEFPPFYEYWYDSEKIAALFSLLPFEVDETKCFGIAVAAVGFVFVYLCTLLVWGEIARIARENGLLQGISRGEWMLYAALLLLSLLYVTAAFNRSQAFYGTQYLYDVLYTSDSPILIKQNAYFALYHPQNDIRQPLFAVFSAPFLAIPKLVVSLTGADLKAEAILLDYVQVAMVLAANFLLARMMDLDRGGRICFMVLGCCTYTYLLFIVMMEQYIIAYFWLMLCLYTICREGHTSRLALWGAGGTLLISMSLVLFAPRKDPRQNFTKWLVGVLFGGLEFLILMLAFRRLDIFLSSKESLLLLWKNFGGGMAVPWANRILQYLAFCAGFFFAPAAKEVVLPDGHAMWQLELVTQIQWGGSPF